jgi:hypothetical protein
MARFVYPQHRTTKPARSAAIPFWGPVQFIIYTAGLFGSVALLLIALLMHI